ncbi:hypothetical protein G6F70_007850 [Rhizopus microsporus]|nr:hypothetical protein G6F71_006140 [Rhizopus microsporus]KAG1195929.1 hypothetical protein G6F70_007850 [Rhizopus microsporus]KAG1207786.1 hypothetical protein G6F69_007755 [Rhizopus microsporus]KAG1231312.1 hypothetical protein G6F67_005841 [Rhizopus microsporus]KAG1260693.1 hypothetical protein G6F68_007247 [Rhizopus microsporus]
MNKSKQLSSVITVSSSPVSLPGGSNAAKSVYTQRATQQTSNRPTTGGASVRPKTATTAVTRTQAPKCIMSVTEGRGVAIEVGICIFDVNSCECTLSQFADSTTFARTIQKISLNDPQKILHFNDEMGINYIKHYGLQEDIPGLLVGVSSKYYCLAATSGTFYYLLQNQGLAFSENTIKFSYQGAKDTLMIDTITSRNLELVTNIIKINKENTLLGILDKTITPMGKRLLRMNILQPSCCLEVITDRLDAIQELSASEECLFNIQSSLRPLSDLDYIISFIVKLPNANHKTVGRQMLAVHHSESKINQVICPKQSIKSIQNIAFQLPCHSNPDGICVLLTAIYKVLSEPIFAELEELVNNVVNEDVGIEKTGLGLRNQKCYAVKAGVNARQAYKEAIEDTYELVSEYSENTGLKMKLQFSASSGFFIQMSTSELSDGNTLPDKFINVVTKRKMLHFTTLEILQSNSRINESLMEVYLMSDKVVSELLQVFRDNINILYKASEAIALLDMLASLASCKLSYGYVRPTFSDVLAIKSGRHPILDHILTFPLVPNDTFASLSSSFQFITGPNMSGKSTYLRQVALLNVMAHIGSFVPAEYASFRLCDQLLSRLANDNILSDTSTSSFMTEMKETAYLLQNVTNSSVVIIDELCRSTSPNNAVGVAAAVCEELARTKAFCFFATHLHELTRTLVIYPNVVNLRFKVDVRMDDRNCMVDYQYKIEDGHLSTEQNYGLQTAQLLGFPKNLLLAAYQIVKELKKNKQTAYTNEKAKEVSKERKLLWFADKMLQLDQANLNDEQLLEQLTQLQDDMAKEFP